MRQCRIASCCKLAHHPCCVDCKNRACESRCMNSPERCGCCENNYAPRRKAAPPAKHSYTGKIDREELLRLNNLGLRQREIAPRLGCSASRVSAILRDMGVRRYG